MSTIADVERCVLVRGIGEIGSAVAHALFRHGYRVVVHDVPAPLTTRRGMAFADAMFDGAAVLTQVGAQRCDSLAAIDAVLAAGRAVPVTGLDVAGAIAHLRPLVLIDARMRKRAQPESQRGLAPLTIGLGPNFVAGGNVDLAVETEWGERLGAVIEQGATAPLRGEPRPIAGHVRDRFVYASRAGRFAAVVRIGVRVRAGETVARLDGDAVVAPLDGYVRGLVHDGLEVTAGTRVLEIDPRVEAPVFSGIGERPRRIAAGVLATITARWPTLTKD